MTFAACGALATGNTFSANLVPNYQDGAGEGFNDPTLGAARQSAFEYALGLWSAVLGDAYAGETITVDAKFDPLGGSSTSATLGFAGANSAGFVSGNPLGPNVFYLAALRNHLTGSDVSGGSEISATFNSDVDGPVLGSTSWYYGTDEMSGSDIDFVETALHEIAHGLGWSGTINVETGAYNNGALYNSYDHFVQRTSDGAPMSGLSDADRYTALTNDDISWNGPLGIAANSGVAPDLYGPNPEEPGSSYSHLDEGDFPAELMSPFASPASGHAFSGLTLGVLQDQGWTIIPEPSSGVFLLGAAGLALLRRRRNC